MTHREEVELLLASRPDLTSGQRAYLRTRTASEVAALLASPAMQVQAGGRAERHESSAGAVRAARSNQAEQIAERFGRSTKKPTIHWEGNELVLERISKQDALAILASRGEAPPPRRPVVGLALEDNEIQDARRQHALEAARSVRGKPVTP